VRAVTRRPDSRRARTLAALGADVVGADMADAEIMQLHGAWSDAMDEVRRASARVSLPPGPPGVVGMVCYWQAELHRLRGEFAKAEHAYREATQHGRMPQPGMAQLRLAQRRVDAAGAAIRTALDEAQDRWLGPGCWLRTWTSCWPLGTSRQRVSPPTS
jgi:hypothetical protein